MKAFVFVSVCVHVCVPCITDSYSSSNAQSASGHDHLGLALGAYSLEWGCWGCFKGLEVSGQCYSMEGGVQEAQ